MRAEFHWYTADLVELGGLMFLFIDKIIKHLLSQELDKYCINSCTYTMHFLAAVSYLLACSSFYIFLPSCYRLYLK